MAIIGSFTRTKSGYSGGLRTLTLDLALVLVSVEPGEAERRRIIASTSMTKTARTSAPAGNAAATRPAIISPCSSTIRC